MEVRRLTVADAGLAWALRREALEREPASFGESLEEFEALSVEALAARLGSGGDDSFVYGAFEGGVLAGMAGFFRETRVKRRHQGTIWGVYVSPCHRRRGVGRAVMQAVLDHARRLPGLRSVYLSVTSAEPAARDLYLSLGFRSFGIEPRALAVDGRFYDEEHMLLELE